MTLKARLDALTRRFPERGPGYTWPALIDVRGLTPLEKAAAIAGAEERSENKRFRGVRLVILDQCEPRQINLEVS